MKDKSKKHPSKSEAAKKGWKKLGPTTRQRDHMTEWVKRNATYGDEIAKALPKGGIVTKLPVSNQITKWVYAQTETANGLTWLRKDEMAPLEERWRFLFAS